VGEVEKSIENVIARSEATWQSSINNVKNYETIAAKNSLSENLVLFEDCFATLGMTSRERKK